MQKKLGSKWSKISIEFPRKSENLLKNAFYSRIRKNIRRLNKNKANNERIVGAISNLLAIPEVRAILEFDVFQSNQEFINKYLPSETLNLTKEMAQPQSVLIENDHYEFDIDSWFDS